MLLECFNKEVLIIKLKKLEKFLKKIDKGYYAIGEHGYNYYSLDINDIDEENDKKYIMNISTLRCIILQSIFFDEANEIVHHLEGVKLKVEKDLW